MRLIDADKLIDALTERQTHLYRGSEGYTLLSIIIGAIEEAILENPNKPPKFITDWKTQY